MEDRKTEVRNRSRRKLLKDTKSAATFIIPTILTFKLENLVVAASKTLPGFPDWD